MPKERGVRYRNDKGAKRRSCEADNINCRSSHWGQAVDLGKQASSHGVTEVVNNPLRFYLEDIMLTFKSYLLLTQLSPLYLCYIKREFWSLVNCCLSLVRS